MDGPATTCLRALRPGPTPLGSRAYAAGVGTCTALVAIFLGSQLMASPPHEDETLALFVCRHDLVGMPGIVLGQGVGAPLHVVLAWLVAHLGGGFVERALVDATADGGRRRWLIWGVLTLLAVAAHPYGGIVLASQATYAAVHGRRRWQEVGAAFAAVAVLAIPCWRTYLVLAGPGLGGVGAALPADGRGRLHPGVRRAARRQPRSRCARSARPRWCSRGSAGPRRPSPGT